LQATLLTIAEGAADGPVVPRQVVVETGPGPGRLVLEGSVRVDAEWRDSVQAAWDHALALSGSPRLDAELRFPGARSLSGPSAGLTVGLLALACIARRELPPFFATGACRQGGMLAGGQCAAAKAEAARELAAQAGNEEAWFLCPPLEAPPQAQGLHVACRTSLAAAWRTLAPGHALPGEAWVEARRRRAAEAAGMDTRLPFALVWGRMGEGDAGLQVARMGPAPRGGARVVVGECGRVLWESTLGQGEVPADVPGRLLALARRASE
jgi:hypothetical protein